MQIFKGECKNFKQSLLDPTLRITSTKHKRWSCLENEKSPPGFFIDEKSPPGLFVDEKSPPRLFVDKKSPPGLFIGLLFIGFTAVIKSHD